MENKQIVKEYSNDDITIIWKPGVCIHAGVCVRKLPKVYNPNNKPWISIENAEVNELVNQINACPSGALSYKLKNNNKYNTMENNNKKGKSAGSSPVIVAVESGNTKAWCACGHSSNQPWCDGSHKGTGLSPVIFKVEEDKKVAMCMCKKTSNAPHCDGSHAN